MDQIHQRESVPGPKGLPVVGVARYLNRERLLPFLDEMRKLYGDFIHLPFPVMKLYVVNQPNWIKHILQDKASNYVRTIFYEKMEPIFGKGIVTSEGEFWRRQRKLMQPAFHAQKIAKAGQISSECALALSERLEILARTEESFDLSRHFMQIALEIVTTALFSVQLTQAQKTTISESMDTVQEHMGDSFWTFFRSPLWLPTARNRKLNRAKASLNAIIDEMIRTHRNAKEPFDDLLSVMMAASDGDAFMTDEQVRDEVVTLLIAGHETTANALAWTFHLLLKHPGILQKLRQEIANAIGSRTPVFSDLPNLTYAKWVIEESMRLYPPAYFFSRKAVEEDTIGKYTIPKNSVVLLSPWLMHKHPDFWENPESFDPERFSPEKSKSRPKYSYFPFGGGAHFCIGASMAMVEAQIILTTLVQKFDFIPLNANEMTPDPLITLRIRPQMSVKAKLCQTRISEGTRTVGLKNDLGSFQKGCPFDHSSGDLDQG